MTFIVDTGQMDWRARAWLLERSFPERYGRRTKTEVIGEDGGPVTLLALEQMVGVADPDGDEGSATD